jgi:predicted TIM-barrel fold metal-dependent hydrolase
MTGGAADTLQATTDAGRRSTGPVIDTDIHNYLTHAGVLAEYLPARWREYYETFGTRTPNSIAFFPTRPRNMAARSDAWPESGPPGSDLPFLRKQHLDQWDIPIGILNPLEQIFMGSQFPLFSAALTTALNEYTLQRWVEPEPRLYSSICIPYEDAELSVAEIRRLADNPRFVQVLLNLRTSAPLGTRKYWKIYEAAEELGLPVAVHVGGVGGNTITGGGFPSYYFEDHAGYPQAFHAHVTSLVCEGVFEAFPSLKWVLQEGGFAWVPWLSWRLDRAWHVLGHEVPHVRELPSTYIRRHFWYTTQPIEEPERPGQFAQLLEQLRGLGILDRLMFSSDYPHWDFDAPDRALPREMSRELKRQVLSGNAAALYGFDDVG